MALSQLQLEEDTGFLKPNLSLAVSLLLLFLLHTHFLCSVSRTDRCWYRAMLWL